MKIASLIFLMSALIQPLSQRDAMDLLRGGAEAQRTQQAAARKTLAEANWQKLSQAVKEAMSAKNITLDMDVVEMELLAREHIKGHNINNWVNPHDPKKDPRSVLLQYQFENHHAVERFIISLWSRQTGKDFTLESVAAADCYSIADTRWNIFAPSERQSILSMDQGAIWAQAFGLFIENVTESNAGVNPALAVRSTEIEFSNRSRIRALPGMPHTVRGDSANVGYTEADFFEKWRETWRAGLPMITNETRGGPKKCRIVTTPNGNGSGVHELWEKDDKLIQWKRHLITIWHAYLMGALVDPFMMMEAMNDPEGWAQEFLCQFIDGSNVLLPYELIATCESAEASLSDTPALLKQSPLRKVAGIDFGRVNDPTVMTLALNGLGINIVRNITKLKGMSTPDQVATLKPYLDLCDRVCVDYTGPGIGFGDELVKLYGEWKPEDHKLNGKVELCTFTLPLKRDLFPALRVAFEKRNIRVPVDTWLREDLHAMAQVITNGQYNYKAPRSDEGHSDGCTALALMQRASEGAAEGGFKLITPSQQTKSANALASMWGRLTGRAGFNV